MILAGCSPCRDCDPPEPETPVYPSVTETPKIYSFIRGNAWSAVAYNDVTIAEIHTSISDFELSSNPPSGYSLRLKKTSQKDGAGYYVYRVVCDMEAITETTSSNENVKLEIPYTLTGTSISGGKTKIEEVKQKATIQRFLAPDKATENNFFSNFWYLSEYTVYSNVDWVTFISDDTYSEEKEPTYSFLAESSPIKKEWDWEVVTGYDMDGNEYRYETPYPCWTCTMDLPGWVKSKVLKNDLVDTRFVYDDYPLDYGCSVYMVTDQVMWCMKAVYSNSGELQQVYHYKFTKYEPEVPEKPEK